jgi:hypothetical protein
VVCWTPRGGKWYWEGGGSISPGGDKCPSQYHLSDPLGVMGREGGGGPICTGSVGRKLRIAYIFIFIFFFLFMFYYMFIYILFFNCFMFLIYYILINV